MLPRASRLVRYTGLVGALLGGLAVATPASAICAVCNASVRFDQTLATCFTERLDEELRRLESGGLGFVIVDLSDCEKAADRGTLPVVGAEVKLSEPLDASFVADAGALRCLGEAIAGSTAELDPSFLFDLARICP